MFKEEIIPVFYKSIWRVEKEEIHPNMVWSQNNLDAKTREVWEKEITGQFHLWIKKKKNRQNASKLNLAIYKKDMHHIQVEFVLGMKGWFIIW